MREQQYVSYFRVSTDKQGASGLGLEAQRTAVNQFLAGRAATGVIAEFVEIESGSKNDRPQLALALEAYGAGLVRQWLVRLRRDGIVRSATLPKGQGLKWGLINWCDEIAAKAVD